MATQAYLDYLREKIRQYAHTAVLFGRSAFWEAFWTRKVNAASDASLTQEWQDILNAL